jgi:hypothetical protein
VTEPESFSDCIYFWNLRALRPLRLGSLPMLILPVDQVHHWMGFPDQLAHALERPAQFVPDVALSSDSLPEPKLHETASLLELQRDVEEPRIGHDFPVPTRQPPFTYRVGLDPKQWLNFERSYGELTDVDVQLFRDKTNVRFTSPVEFHGGATALVRLNGPALHGLPRRLAVAKRIINVGESSTWENGAMIGCR